MNLILSPKYQSEEVDLLLKTVEELKKMHSQGYFILSYDSLDLIQELMAVEVGKKWCI